MEIEMNGDINEEQKSVSDGNDEKYDPSFQKPIRMQKSKKKSSPQKIKKQMKDKDEDEEPNDL